MKGKSTQELIIEILSNEWPLTTKQIFNKLKRNYGTNISYQAVHKHLKEMIEEKTLTKNEKEFMLSYSWVKKTSDYGKKLETLLKETKRESGSTLIILNSLVEAGKFVVNDFLGTAPEKHFNPENKDSVCLFNHAWPIIGASQEDHERMKKILSETTHYNICAHSTFLDRITCDYVEKLGKKVALNKKFSAKIDTFVEGDYIMQAYPPRELENEMDRLYKKVKTEKDFDMKEMFEFGSKNYEIKIIIFKNQKLADSLREEAKKLYFETQKEKKGKK